MLEVHTASDDDCFAGEVRNVLHRLKFLLPMVSMSNSPCTSIYLTNLRAFYAAGLEIHAQAPWLPN